MIATCHHLQAYWRPSRLSLGRIKLDSSSALFHLNFYGYFVMLVIFVYDLQYR